MKIVIMAGGGGTRLWPASREKFPKQFQKLVGNKSLLQQTYARARKIVTAKDIVIATNQRFLKEIKKQLPQVPAQNFVLEPAKRDNAAAVGLNCLEIAYRIGSPKEVMVMLPADHVIQNIEKFKNLIQKGARYIKQNPDYILTLGIKPTYPETGYGYIESSGEVLGTIELSPLFSVKRFVEKPDIKKAKKYIRNDNYYWNSGIFLWRVGHMLELYRQNLPQIYQGLLKIKQSLGKTDYRKNLAKIYPALQKTSVDFGIMEKVKKIGVIPVNDLKWNDIGNWAAVHDLKEKDQAGNAVSKNVLTLDSKNNLILSDKKLVAVLGVENIVLIETPDAILVARKDRVHEVKKLLAKVPNKYL
ncbi:MAG: mannose-1-phosphate guanylyltransferase [Candidatus Gracilibacteria bacterium]|nr:mannose-1-phosphate guanylyltransferase [Candidatus Gracilibacteria bacterium]